MNIVINIFRESRWCERAKGSHNLNGLSPQESVDMVDVLLATGKDFVFSDCHHYAFARVGQLVSEGQLKPSLITVKVQKLDSVGKDCPVMELHFFDSEGFANPGFSIQP